MTEFPSAITSYTPERLCGQGGYGAVWRVRDAVGSCCALKIVYKNTLADWRQEFNGLAYYRNKVSPHPNLIRIFHIEDGPDFFWYTMECADDLSSDGNYLPDTLGHRISRSGPLEPALLTDIFGQLAGGLEHLHAAGLIHRDIKPENIIFASGIPKFGDIGLVSLNALSGKLAGTQCFIPPEYLTGHERKLKREIDLYALGKTLYCAFSGQEPEQFPLVPAQILRDPHRRQLNQLVKQLCAETPRRRMVSISEMSAALGKISGMHPSPPFMIRLTACLFRWLWRMLILFLILVLLYWLGVTMLVYLGMKKPDLQPDQVRTVRTEGKNKSQPVKNAVPTKPAPEPVKPKPQPVKNAVPPKPAPEPQVKPKPQPVKPAVPTKPTVKPAKEPETAVRKQVVPRSASAPARRPANSVPRKEPQMIPAKKMSRRLYRDIQEHICDAILENEILKPPVLSDPEDISPQDVIIDSFYEHEKIGMVYVFRIPSREIRGRMRLAYYGPIRMRGLANFFIKDKKISFTKRQ